MSVKRYIPALNGMAFLGMIEQDSKAWGPHDDSYVASRDHDAAIAALSAEATAYVDKLVAERHILVARNEALRAALGTLFAACDAPIIHHAKLGPQWCIEMALRFIVTDAWVDKAKAKFQWESGSAP